MNWLKRLVGAAPAAEQAATTPNELASALRHGQAPFVLDVRNPDEYAEAHIAGATLIPLDQLPQRLNEVPAGQRVVCVCRSGARSASATSLLQRHGYDACNMRGGMLEWARQGLPIERGEA